MTQHSWLSEISQETGTSVPQYKMGILAWGTWSKVPKKYLSPPLSLSLCEEEREVTNVEVLSYELARLQKSMITLPYLLY